MKNKYIKSCSTFLLKREIQFKTKRRLTTYLVVLLKFKKICNNKNWGGCGGFRTFIDLGICNIIKLLWKTVWLFIERLKIHFP